MSDTVSVFVNGTATTENYTYGHTLSLHDALPIWPRCRHLQALGRRAIGEHRHGGSDKADAAISAPGRRQYPAIWGALLRRADSGRPPQRLFRLSQRRPAGEHRRSGDRDRRARFQRLLVEQQPRALADGQQAARRSPATGPLLHFTRRDARWG